MSKAIPYLILLLLGAACFTFATSLQPSAMTWSQSGQDSILKVMLGDGRRLLANQFFTKADVYLHSGYYPSIFDRSAPKRENHVAEHEDEEHEKETDFLGPPKDIFESFGRHFMVTEHTHLGNGQENEILPWLQLSADLDPQLINTYTVAAYWLANRLGRVTEAEKFLHQGLHANPDSFEILFELGRIYFNNYHDPVRARNVWELALRRWREQEPQKKEPDKFALHQIATNLARLEEQEGNLGKAIEYMELAKTVSPSPEALQGQIDELKRKLPAKP